MQLKKIMYLKFLLYFGFHVNKKYEFCKIGLQSKRVMIFICIFPFLWILSSSVHDDYFHGTPKLIFFILGNIKSLLSSMDSTLQFTRHFPIHSPFSLIILGR